MNNMNNETLRITWKYIRWAGQGRTPMSYCTYVAENENHKHKLKTKDGTKLFELLKKTRIYKDRDQSETELFVDGVYEDNKLLYVTNFRKL
jgi:hypothetical protein